MRVFLNVFIVYVYIYVFVSSCLNFSYGRITYCLAMFSNERLELHVSESLARGDT